MRRALFLLCVALAGGAGIGWLTAHSVGAPEGARAPALAGPEHAGADARRARERLAQLVPAVPENLEEALEAPPPPDIAVLFRHDLTAIERRPEGSIAWIVDFTREFGRRGLKVGDVYQDGWRVSAIGAQTIELRRQSELRRVGVFELPQESVP